LYGLKKYKKLAFDSAKNFCFTRGSPKAKSTKNVDLSVRDTTLTLTILLILRATPVEACKLKPPKPICRPTFKK
jgi:hypothetical protein